MLSLLLALSLAVPQPKIEVPVTLSQRGTAEWGVLAVAHGKASQPNKSTLEITLSDLSLQANPKYGKDRPVKEIKICIARPLPENAWEPVKCSSELRIDALIKSGDSLTMQDLNFSIPIPKRSTIASYFLVLTIEAPGRRGRQGSYHANSEGDPLQELQDLIASQRR